MDELAAFRLGRWQIDPATGVLACDGETQRLSPKVMDVLVVLRQHPGRVVGRDELLHAVWGERAVTDEPLTRAIAELRRALGDDRAQPEFIETIPKRGYRLVAAVAAAGPPAPQPGGMRTGGRNLWLAAAAALAAVAAIWLGLSQPPSSQAPRSVAVLPLTDLNGRADMQYFADGVHDEIITRLANNTTLEVASRGAVMALRDALLTPQAIAARLGVASVIQGTTLHADGRVRVNVEHVDADSGRVLWSRSFDRPLSVGSLFEIQAEIAAGVAAGFAPEDPTAAQSLPTATWDAYEAFLLGKYHYRRRQPGDMRLAVDYLQAAVDADPVFAEAWDWLAYAWNHAGVVAGWTTPTEAFPRARAAAARAIELDPRNATAPALLGYLRAVFDWDWLPALAELDRARAAAPSESGTVWSHAYVLSLRGQHEEAVALTRALMNIYPGQGRFRLETAWRLLDAQRLDEAGEAARLSLEEGAEAGMVHELLGACAFATGDFDAAVTELERAVTLQRRAPGVVARLAAAYAALGKRAEAQTLLAEIETVPNGFQADPVDLAIVHTGLGNTDAALRLLERAVEEKRRGVLEIRNNPFLAAVRDSPRYFTILELTGLDNARG